MCLPNSDTAYDIGESLADSLTYCCKGFYSTFLAHPRKNGMSYCTHFTHAMYMSYRMCLGSFYLAVHSFVPSVFEKSGSNTIAELYMEHKVAEMAAIKRLGQSDPSKRV
jgi:hypothetical protein